MLYSFRHGTAEYVSGDNRADVEGPGAAHVRDQVCAHGERPPADAAARRGLLDDRRGHAGQRQGFSGLGDVERARGACRSAWCCRSPQPRGSGVRRVEPVKSTLVVLALGGVMLPTQSWAVVIVLFPPKPSRVVVRVRGDLVGCDPVIRVRRTRLDRAGARAREVVYVAQEAGRQARRGRGEYRSRRCSC